MKNYFKKLFIITSVVIFSLQVFAADFKADNSNVKFLGRTFFEDGILWTGFSASGAGFKTNSKSLEITFAGDSTAMVRKIEGATNIARIAVFVNGERKANVLMSKKEIKTVVFENEDSTEKEILIVKLSETGNSICGIKNIAIDDGAKITPLAAKSKKIEFIGDSITCGYGVDDEDKNHHFSTQTEDATKTYAYKTATALDADYSMVSLSGWGIISGYSGDGTKQKNQTIPLAYDKTAYSYGTTYGSGKTTQNKKWDFSLFQPDVVVINLGTNDSSYTKGKADRIEDFKNEYIKFLKTVREKNPNAEIVCTLGLMGADLFPAIQNAVKEFSAETGDKKVSTVKLPQTTDFAADWHPAEKSHAKGATVLTEFIGKILE